MVTNFYCLLVIHALLVTYQEASEAKLDL